MVADIIRNCSYIYKILIINTLDKLVLTILLKEAARARSQAELVG